MANSLVKLTLESNQYEQGLRQAQQMWKSFTDSIGLSAQKFTTVGIAIGSVTGALKVAKDAFNNSQATIDEWGRTIQSAQSLYDGFLTALNNSDISGFLTRMDEIVEAAKSAYDAMSELEMFTAFNQKGLSKSRAGYNKALDEYKLNPSAENRKRLSDANAEVKANLEQAKAMTQEAYEKALRSLAVNSIKSPELQNRFIDLYKNKSWDDLERAAAGYRQGSGLNAGAQYYYGNRVYDGRIQERSTGKWSDMSQTEREDFEFARAVSTAKKDVVENIQRLGAQFENLDSQIYAQDRMYNRMAGNNKPTPHTTTRTTQQKQELTELEANQKRINALTQEYVDISSSTVEVDQSRLITIREEIDELTKRNDLLKLYAEQAKGLYLGGGASVYGLTSSQFRGLAAADLSVGGIDPSLLPTTGAKTITNRFLHKNDEGKMEAHIDEIFGGMSTGISQIVSGIENLGIEIPDSIKGVLNAVQGITSILSGIATMVTAIVALQQAGLIKFWSNGGVVHAMGGYEVPGNYGYDAVPSMLTSGELVLNRSQQNTLASALKEGGNGGGGGGVQMARLSGEQIYVAINRYLSRSGKGELVTWR